MPRYYVTIPYTVAREDTPFVVRDQKVGLTIEAESFEALETALDVALMRLVNEELKRR